MKKRLEYLGLWTLEERRNRADLRKVFRMYKGLPSTTTPFNNFFVSSFSKLLLAPEDTAKRTVGRRLNSS